MFTGASRWFRSSVFGFPFATVVVAPLAVLACPIPAPIDGPEDELSQPPRIALTAVDPAVGLVTVSQSSAQVSFTIAKIEDPNVGDTLTVRFFVDYYRDTSVQREAIIQPDPNSPTPTARTGASFVASMAVFGPSPTMEPHVVEAIVSDRGFVETGASTNVNRNVPQDANTAYVSWTVKVTP